jgi:hypothetical protein
MTTSKTPKTNHSIAGDGEAASTVSMPCYTMSGLEQKLGVDFGEKVQSNVRVRRWFRDKEKELAEKYASSTCEFHESLVVSMWLADQGIKEFLVMTPKVNFYAQPVVVRYVKKRRRKIVVDDEEYVQVLATVGEEGKCHNCGGIHNVSSYLSADLNQRIFLCPYCAIKWSNEGLLRVSRI